MERARKMILVPEDTFQPAQSVSPVFAVDEMPSKEPDVGEKGLQTTGDNFYEKCLNYLQILRCYLFFRDNEIEETRAPLCEEAILSTLAKIHAPKARRLLRHWKTNAAERLKRHNTGTVRIDGRVIPRSNITELLLDALHRKPKEDNEAPVDRYEFAQFLKASDTPTDLIGNPKVLKIGQILTAE